MEFRVSKSHISSEWKKKKKRRIQPMVQPGKAVARVWKKRKPREKNKKDTSTLIAKKN
jgi:hypothetical protein